MKERGCVHACESACACVRARHSIVCACRARTRVRVGTLWMREGEGGEDDRSVTERARVRGATKGATGIQGKGKGQGKRPVWPAN